MAFTKVFICICYALTDSTNANISVKPVQAIHLIVFRFVNNNISNNNSNH